MGNLVSMNNIRVVVIYLLEYQITFYHIQEQHLSIMIKIRDI